MVEYPRKIIADPWNKWFAWYPVKVQGRWFWLTFLYRRRIIWYKDLEEWSYYEYGDVFDVMK